MFVLVPTQHLEVMQAWDGGLGLLARLPGLRRLIGVLLTLWRLRNNGLMAWPNISAGRAVVPERVGAITPEQIAAEASDWLASPIVWKGSARIFARCVAALVPWMPLPRRFAPLPGRLNLPKVQLLPAF